MKLNDNWQSAHKVLSVQALAITAALPTIWLQLPPEWRAAIPPHWLAVASVVMGVIGVCGHLINPTPPSKP